MADFFKKPVFAAILLIALIVGGIWAYVSYHQSVNQKAEDTKKAEEQNLATSEAEKTLNNLATVDPTKLADQITNQLQVADSKAIEADKRSLLSAVEIRLPKENICSGENTQRGLFWRSHSNKS
ncbi:MAG: hypothetical protein Athens101428_728 [Candidatus Berkelbacteria bacterium Athens1014_28]|uniref:Uncharacterized protein n=1 Tax=Candidatus Berkelbacteria bacterium Athens1014_28 TaxID=2017145 RepID=A0A554LK38_9BACT|nr:MAG: hypothetical protein Athens101428_728 [Candidatus Berkelbacteria bacterium Athens1014_28]